MASPSTTSPTRKPTRLPTPKASSRSTASVRPLLVRPEARYTCFGDGLCCTDIHALGPLTPKERRDVELIEPGRLVRHKDLGAYVFRTTELGACVLRSSRGCELHAVHGAAAKPDGCSRFPYGLVATPEGGRVTTEHRCPCRSLGDRPPLDEADAEASLSDRGHHLMPNGRVEGRVRMNATTRVSFLKFRELEKRMIESLLVGEPPETVFGIKPFGRLRGEKFADIAAELIQERDGSACGEAMVWFANATLSCLDGRPLPLIARPWSRYFDIAEARPGVRSAQAVLSDYLADLLWSMDWYFSVGSFQAARRELATLHAVASRITKRLIRAKTQPGRAAAEAVMIVELSRQAGAWARVQKAL